MNRWHSLVLLLLLPLSNLTANTDLTDADLIVAKANQAAFYNGNDGRSEIRMLIVDSQQRKQRRQFVVLRRNQPDKAGDQQFLIRFSQPSDIRNTVFLINKHIATDDDRWLYLPGLDLVKRIAAGDKRTSFVGSDFFYEDVSGRGLKEDKHQLIETTDQFYVIKNTPKEPALVEFTEYTVWIDKKTFMPIKTEYTDNSDKIYRRIEAQKIVDVQGFPTAVMIKASNLRSGSYTLNQLRNISYDIKIPADVFSERSLRNPPREWLKPPAKR